MISCAPRLKKDNGPTWTSVSIHWTDSDMKRLEPVDGLPWIRTTDKARLFNKNGPLRVVASYRTTDGVDPKTEYRHVSMIADAIEQYVLVKIVMPKEVSAKPGADWPRFRVWAFLQPPIIGRDKKRRDVNGGYVVDDIPRAGWFEAVVDGRTMTGEEIDYSRGHKSPPGKKPLKVTGERDASNPRVVRFKIRARVANNESEAELKEKSQKLRKKKQDVSLMEAGSYLKVWVRNEERTWPTKPLDDDSEKIVQSMADSDSIKPGTGSDPRKFRNHTWKRSRLATHKSVAGKIKNPDQALLYVGLYPAHVIDKIEKFEAKIANTGKHESHPLAWLMTVIAWTLLAQGAKALRTKVAAKQNGKGAVGDESPYMKTTQQIAELFENAQLSELFASYAVAGYDEFSDVMGKVEAAQVHHANGGGTTPISNQGAVQIALLDAKGSLKSGKMVRKGAEGFVDTTGALGPSAQFGMRVLLHDIDEDGQVDLVVGSQGNPTSSATCIPGAVWNLRMKHLPRLLKPSGAVTLQGTPVFVPLSDYVAGNQLSWTATTINPANPPLSVCSIQGTGIDAQLKCVSNGVNGISTWKVVASDTGNVPASQHFTQEVTFTVSVVNQDSAPVRRKDLPKIVLHEDQTDTAVVALYDYFRDPEGLPMTFRLVPLNGSASNLLNYSLSGDTIHLSGVKYRFGLCSLQVVARDQGLASVSDTLVVYARLSATGVTGRRIGSVRMQLLDGTRGIRLVGGDVPFRYELLRLDGKILSSGVGWANQTLEIRPREGEYLIFLRLNEGGRTSNTPLYLH